MPARAGRLLDVFKRNPWREFIAGARGKPPRFVAALMVGLLAGVVVGSVQEFLPLLDGLRLSRAVWQDAQIWRIVSYGWVGTGAISMWSLVHLALTYWCVMETVVLLGLRATRILIAGGVVVAGVAACAAQMLTDHFGGPTAAAPFWLMQGQHVIFALTLPAFATRNRHAVVSHTPYLLGLPIPTRWLIPLQLLATTLAFTATRDLGGFVGILAAIGWSVYSANRER